jgi:hypothetical protein
MNRQTLLWAGLAILAWTAWRDYLRARIAASASGVPVTVNSDTDIIEEDDTGEALERLIGRLEENMASGQDRWVSFQADTPELQISYTAKPFQSWVLRNPARGSPSFYVP